MIPDYSETLKRYACKAMKTVLEACKSFVPLQFIVADGIEDADGPHLRVIWQDERLVIRAEGRFYPNPGGEPGGRLMFHHLRAPGRTEVPVTRHFEGLDEFGEPKLLQDAAHA